MFNSFFSQLSILTTAGKVGDWRNHLSKEMSDKIDRMVNEKLNDLHVKFDYGN